jgi:hypothetical protein
MQNMTLGEDGVIYLKEGDDDCTCSSAQVPSALSTRKLPSSSQDDSSKKEEAVDEAPKLPSLPLVLKGKRKQPPAVSPSSRQETSDSCWNTGNTERVFTLTNISVCPIGQTELGKKRSSSPSSAY